MSDHFAKIYITYGLKINLEKLLAKFRLSLSDGGNMVKGYMYTKLVVIIGKIIGKLGKQLVKNGNR